MKKVLLATTILGMTSGFAAAEIAFTGTATAGFGSDQGKSYQVYNSFTLSIAATGETDSGLAFGVTTSISTDSEEFTLSDGHDRAGTTDGMENPEIFVSGAFGKIAFKENGFADYYSDDDSDYDVEYSISVADFDFGARSSLRDDNGYSVSLGYENGGIALGLVYDDADSDDGEGYKASAEYTTGPFTIGAAVSENVYDLERTHISVAYADNGLTLSAKALSDDSYSLEAAYEVDALSLSVSTDDQSEWEATASYDFGGGLKAVVGADFDDSAYFGAEMSF